MSHFEQLNQDDYKEIMPGFFGHFIHTESMTFAYWKIKAGAVLPEHNHVHEQVANMISGEFMISIDGEEKVLKPGMVGVIPSNAVHFGKAITDCEIIDVFQPVREDYKVEY